MEGTSKESLTSAHGVDFECLLQGSSLYNGVYLATYRWLHGVVVVMPCVRIWYVGGSILGGNNNLAQYFLRSNSPFHGQADYF